MSHLEYIDYMSHRLIYALALWLYNYTTLCHLLINTFSYFCQHASSLAGILML